MSFTRYTITAADKKANDGTDYVYYKRAGTGGAADTWIVYLQGGGFCRDFTSGDLWDCNNRTAQQTSSTNWPATLPDTTFEYGILGNDQDENPQFYQATHFFFPYLSSDVWLGTDQDVGSSWYFHGKNIAQYIIQELVTTHGLDDTKTLIICGDSAGAVGIYHNLPDWYDNWFATGQSLEDITWYAVAASGWLLDPGTLDPGDDSFEDIVTDAIALWTADSPYMAEFSGTEWEAFKNALFWPYVDDEIKERLLTLNAIPDAIPTNFSQIDLALPLPSPEEDYLTGIATSMYDELSDLNQVFAQAAVSDVDDVATPLHALLLVPSFTRQKVNCRNCQWAIMKFLEGLDFTIVQAWDGEFIPEEIEGSGETSAVTGPTLEIVQAVTFSETVSNLGFPVDWQNVRFTLKASRELTDAQALLQIRVTNPSAADDGLQILNGVATSEYYGACLVLDMDAGTAVVNINHEVTAELDAATNLVYDLKAYNTDDTTNILAAGTAKVALPVTLTI